MACFIVPATEAIVTTVVSKVSKNKKNKNGSFEKDRVDHVSFTNRLDRLNGLLWGGSGLLAFEHLWHGEIQPFFPFLTAASDAGSAAGMLYEMATSGTAMAVVVTAAWAVSVLAEKSWKKNTKKDIVEAEA